MKRRNLLQTNKSTRRHSSPLLWFIPTQFIAIFTAFAIAVGEQMLRVFMLGAMTLAMVIPLMVSLEAGLMAMLIFEPFRGFLRRAQYIFLPYSQTEPIHLIIPVVSFLALMLVLFRHKLETFILTPLAGTVSVLAIICAAQMFNPLQGGLYVGLSGGLFFLVPMAWFYFGQTAKIDFVPKALRLIVVLGLIASVWGVYQMLFGYPYFEQYWIDNTDLYNSIAVYNVQRALATFNSAEEWGRYIQIGSIVAVGLGLSRSEGTKRIGWFGCAGILFVMLAFTGQRASIFGLFLGLIILFMTGAKNLKGALGRVILLFIPMVLILTIPNPVSDDDGYALEENQRVSSMLSHTTKGTLNPTGEGSLYARFQTWNKLITEDIPSNPFGIGLGAKTIAGSREKDSESTAIDNHFLTLALSAGVPAALLLIWILGRATIFCYRGWLYSEADSKEADLWRIMLALMSTFILNNFFGTSFTIYSVAPIGWFLIGWVSVAYLSLQTERDELERANNFSSSE